MIVATNVRVDDQSSISMRLDSNFNWKWINVRLTGSTVDSEATAKFNANEWPTEPIA